MRRKQIDPDSAAPDGAAAPAGAARRSTPQKFQRETNLALVLRALRDAGPASRTELAARVGIDRSTMTSIAGELVAAGLVLEEPAPLDPGRGGRRPVLLSLATRAVLALGVDVAEDRALWCLCALDGSVAARGAVERPREADGPRWLDHALGEVARVALAGGAGAGGANAVGTLGAGAGTAVGAAMAAAPVAGVGIGLPGVVVPAEGELRESVVLGVRDLPVRARWDEVGPGLPPLFVDNDANCCAWNVSGPTGATAIFVQLRLHRSPSGRLRRSLAGVGLSFLIDGRVHSGSSHAAGELRGYRWREGDHDQLGLAPARDPKVAQAGAPAGGAAAEADDVRAVVAELLANLGVIASALDPGRIVLAGDLAGEASLVESIVREECRGAAIEGFAQRGLLEVAGSDDYPVARGAARMVLEHLFALPTVEEAATGAIGWPELVERLVASRATAT